MIDLNNLSIEIARLSADKDEHGSWWGFDTDIGNLPEMIKEKLQPLWELAGAQKELILALNGRSAFGWREILRERAKELRTKIAELEKKTDSTDNVLMGEDDQMGNYL